jgi:hypothetical protein
MLGRNVAERLAVVGPTALFGHSQTDAGSHGGQDE